MTEEREQTKLMRALLEEYKELRQKLFHGEKFLKVEDTPEQRRYDQLFKLFHPQYRTRNWVNPIQQKSLVE